MQQNTENNFESELNRLYPSLLSRAKRMLGSSVEGAELLQQTMLEIMSQTNAIAKLEKVTSDGKLDIYLRLALMNRAKPNSKYSKNRIKIVEYKETVPDIFENIHSKMSNRIANEQIDLIISRLPEFDAELLRLWALPGFSYDEVSKFTGVPKEKLVQINHKSLNKIRKYVHRTTSSPAK